MYMNINKLNSHFYEIIKIKAINRNGSCFMSIKSAPLSYWLIKPPIS